MRLKTAFLASLILCFSLSPALAQSDSEEEEDKVGSIILTNPTSMEGLFDDIQKEYSHMAAPEFEAKFVDKKGKVVIPGPFRYAQSFSNGRAAVDMIPVDYLPGQPSSNQPPIWAYVDTAGNTNGHLGMAKEQPFLDTVTVVESYERVEKGPGWKHIRMLIDKDWTVLRHLTDD